MHIAVTDLLTCPACGPSAGLILLADEIADRRVRTGTLGCPSCHAKFAIQRGIARLDTTLKELDAVAGAAAPEAGSERSGGEGADRRRASDADESMKWAALLGVTEGPGHVLMIGPAAAHAGGMAEMVPGVEFIVATAAVGPAPEPRVSVLRIGERLPLCHSRLRGVGLSGGSADRLLEDAARAVMVGGRLVVRPAPADADARLAEAGMQVLARQGDTLVAQRG